MDKKKNKALIKALILSAGLVALPATSVLADNLPEKNLDYSDIIINEEIDVFENQETVDSLLNKSPKREESISLRENPDQKPSSGTWEEASVESSEASINKDKEESSNSESSSPSADIVVDQEVEKNPDQESFKALEDEEARAGQSLEKGAVMTESRSIIAPPNPVKAYKLARGYFYDGNDKLITNRWVEFRGHYYFPDASGVRYLSRFISFGVDNIYYMDGYGRQYRGILALGDKRYLLDDYSGKLRRDNAWVKRNDGRYFPNAAGELYNNRYITFGSQAYYVDDMGKEHRGISQVGNDLVLFDESRNGRARKDNAWVKYKGKYYFPNAQGKLYRNQFISFGPIRYYMGQDGSRQHGPVKVGSDYYYMDDKTGISQGKIKPGFNIIQGRSYYFDPSSRALIGENNHTANDWRNLRNQAVKKGDDYYYIGSNGRPESGIYETAGKLYFYDPDLSNRRRKVPGKINWQGREYYIQLDSSIVRNDFIVVNKVVYQADRNGALTRNNAHLVLDISRYQKPEEINYDLISDNVSGVILRAGFTGYGTGSSYYKDQTFDRHYRELVRRGVPVGAYWYSCADTVDEGQAEAEFMLNILKGKRFEMPIYWDTEDQYHQAKVSPKQLTDTGIAFLNRLEKEGYYVGIYGSASWLKNRLEMERLNQYDVWVAHYGVSRPRYSGDYGMWQFTSSYYMDGYNKKLDANLVYKDYPSIIRRAGLNNTR